MGTRLFWGRTRDAEGRNPKAEVRKKAEIRNPKGEIMRLALAPSIFHPLSAITEMTIKLSILSVLLGLGVALPQIYGLMKPAAFAAAVRKFPRSLPWGYTLMLLGTGWFLWYLSQESIADFAAYKEILFAGFAAVGIGSCIFVQDFLAVRGLAVVLLLLAKLMVDTGRPHLSETSWVLVIQTWAYVLVVAGIWLTISPWRLRDLLEWCTANEKRIKVGCGIRLAFGLFVAGLGLTKF
jgi:hypothetical protein